MRRRGFTVIEVIIVMAIFSIVLGVIIQIFIFTTRTQRRSRSLQEAHAQGRAAVEALVREAQNGSIDYGFYADAANGVSLSAQPVGVVALRDSQGQSVRFRCVAPATGDTCSAAAPGQVQLCRGSSCDAGGWAGVTDEATDVTSWRTWMGPTADPFARDPNDPSAYLAYEQPWVTVSATLLPHPVAGTTLPPVQLQSTVSSRTYLR